MKNFKMINNLVNEMKVTELRVEDLNICLMDFLADRVSAEDTTIYNVALKDSNSMVNMADEVFFGSAIDVAMRISCYEANMSYIKIIHFINGEWIIWAEY